MVIYKRYNAFNNIDLRIHRPKRLVDPHTRSLLLRLGPRWPKGLAVVAAEATTSGEVSAPIAAVVTHMGQVEGTTHYTGGAAGPEAPLPLESSPCLHHQPCVLSAWHDRHKFVCNPAGARPFAGTALQSFLLLMIILTPCRAVPPAGDR